MRQTCTLIHMTISELSTNQVFVSLNYGRKLEQPEQNPKLGQGEWANSSRKWFKSRIVFERANQYGTWPLKNGQIWMYALYWRSSRRQLYNTCKKKFLEKQILAPSLLKSTLLCEYAFPFLIFRFKCFPVSDTYYMRSSSAFYILPLT